ncbi:MAG: GntR family transcriptional regulator [Peptococcaceae bacterium]|jgi:K+/H+ antiporter YhaU regulatory subunit KhtT|nr:GntR family transcriptional regulator [Peptococcaceae bacterium]
MKEQVTTPVYLRIALDIASRIVRGEFKEKTKIYGRSVMSSEYGVSPETIRRSVNLLADVDIVDVQQNSGTIIISRENAQKYLERFNKQADIRVLQKKLKDLMEENERIHDQIESISNSMIMMNEKFVRTQPFENYEVEVPETSWLVGKNIGELKFWQATGATVIAIRHKEHIVLSPGPYAVLMPKDAIIFVGDLASIEAVRQFVGFNPGD